MILCSIAFSFVQDVCATQWIRARSDASPDDLQRSFVHRLTSLDNLTATEQDCCELSSWGRLWISRSLGGKQTRCSKIHFRVDSYPYCTALEANRCKSGTKRWDCNCESLPRWWACMDTDTRHCECQNDSLVDGQSSTSSHCQCTLRGNMHIPLSSLLSTMSRVHFPWTIE